MSIKIAFFISILVSAAKLGGGYDWPWWLIWLPPVIAFFSWYIPRAKLEYDKMDLTTISKLVEGSIGNIQFYTERDFDDEWEIDHILHFMFENIPAKDLHILEQLSIEQKKKLILTAYREGNGKYSKKANQGA